MLSTIEPWNPPAAIYANGGGMRERRFGKPLEIMGRKAIG